MSLRPQREVRHRESNGTDLDMDAKAVKLIARLGIVWFRALRSLFGVDIDRVIDAESYTAEGYLCLLDNWTSANRLGVIILILKQSYDRDRCRTLILPKYA